MLRSAAAALAASLYTVDYADALLRTSAMDFFGVRPDILEDEVSPAPGALQVYLSVS